MFGPIKSGIFSKCKCDFFKRRLVLYGTSSNLNEVENDVTVYKFPYIRGFSIVNRLKLYQTYATAASVPISVVLNQAGVLPAEGIGITAALGVSGCLSLYGLGLLTQDFVGFIYLNNEKSSVRIAYSDFWGKRKEVQVALDDIVPLSELPTALTDGLYLKLKRYSTKDTLRINVKYGVVLEKEQFKKVFIS